MEAFGFIGLVYLLAGIIQLVILIVLIVKFLQLATDVKQLKNLYTERSRELSSSIDKLSSTIKEQSNSKDNDKTHIAKDENIVAELKKEPNKPYDAAPAKEMPIVDENDDDFKKHLRKWKILKSKGHIDQAIREYMEYTKRDMNSAVGFINSI